MTRENKNRNIVSVIGQGFCGGALTTGMSHAFDMFVYDKAGKVAKGGEQPYVSKLASGIKRHPQNVVEFVETLEGPYKASFTGVYFVCLPTPMLPNGECDTSIVAGVLKEMASVKGERIAVVKSTIPPGTTESWNKEFENSGLTVVFNPEFLTERNAVEDFKNQNRIVLGGPKHAVNKVRDVYRNAFPKVPVVKTSSVNAEMNKYVINTFLATKVSFANEIYQICEALKKNGNDIDYDRIVEIVTMDERVGTSHWQVPGPMPDDRTGQLVRGFGGSCFIKDLNALMTLAKTLDVDPKVLIGVWEKNLEVRPQKDWFVLEGRAISIK